jgi:hypothetical protein
MVGTAYTPRIDRRADGAGMVHRAAIPSGRTECTALRLGWQCCSFRVSREARASLHYTVDHACTAVTV